MQIVFKNNVWQKNYWIRVLCENSYLGFDNSWYYTIIIILCSLVSVWWDGKKVDCVGA